MKITLDKAKQYIPTIWMGKCIPMLHASPGVGKSYIIKELAKEFKLKLIDFRLSQCDPSDFNGLISFNQDKTKSTYVPMETFPTTEDAVPEGYKGWLIFFDEINAAPPALQAAAYKILDGDIGQTKIHPKVVMAAAGNLITDKAVVNRTSTAMKSRLIHLEIENSLEGFTNWALKNSLDTRILAYLNYRPNHLHVFDPSSHEHTFPCNRTWEFVSKMTKKIENLETIIPVIAGAIGEGTALEYVAFNAVYKDLPKFEDIVKKPEETKIPENPATLYAVTYHIAEKVSYDTFKQVALYINRMPKEFQTLTLRTSIQLNSSLISHPDLTKWVSMLREYLK